MHIHVLPSPSLWYRPRSRWAGRWACSGPSLHNASRGSGQKQIKFEFHVINRSVFLILKKQVGISNKIWSSITVFRHIIWETSGLLAPDILQTTGLKEWLCWSRLISSSVLKPVNTENHGHHLAVDLRNGGESKFTLLAHHLHWFSVILEKTGNKTKSFSVEVVPFSKFTLLTFGIILSSVNNQSCVVGF